MMHRARFEIGCPPSLLSRMASAAGRANSICLLVQNTKAFVQHSLASLAPFASLLNNITFRTLQADRFVKRQVRRDIRAACLLANIDDVEFIHSCRRGCQSRPGTEMT